MRIEAYFQQIEKIIEACPVIQLTNVTYEKRSTHEGFIRGEINFVDGSTSGHCSSRSRIAGPITLIGKPNKNTY